MVRTMVYLVFAGVLLAAGAARAEEDSWPDCTVEMMDGTVHEHVDVTWKIDGLALGLRGSDRQEFNVSPLDVARIHDATGRHITEEVADACPADVSYALLGSRRVEPTGIGLCADVGGSLSFTSGFGGYNPAGAFFAGLRKELSLTWHLRAQYRRQRIEESVPDLGSPLGTWSHEISLLVGYRPIHPRRNRNYSYVEAGPVLVAWDTRWDSYLLSTVDGGDPALGFLLRGGVLLRMGDHLGLDLGAMASLRPAIDVHSDDLGVVIGLNVAVAVY